jgi:hypothetical protein
MTAVDWTIEWEDPPTKDTWMDRLGPLMEHPERYAKVAEGPYEIISRTGWALRHKYKIPAGQWDFRVSKHGDRGQIHAAYLGEEEST